MNGTEIELNKLRITKAMKKSFLICCIIALALVALSCIPETTLEISVSETPDGAIIENIGNADCIVFVTSPDGEQQFELAVGETVTVTDISQPIEVSAVSSGNRELGFQN